MLSIEIASLVNGLNHRYMYIYMRDLEGIVNSVAQICEQRITDDSKSCMSGTLCKVEVRGLALRLKSENSIAM